jgi:hypothetical protein
MIYTISGLFLLYLFYAPWSPFSYVTLWLSIESHGGPGVICFNDSVRDKGLHGIGVTNEVPFRVNVDWNPIPSLGSSATEFKVMILDNKTGFISQSNVTYTLYYFGTTGGWNAVTRNNVDFAKVGKDRIQIHPKNPCDTGFSVDIEKVGEKSFMPLHVKYPNQIDPSPIYVHFWWNYTDFWSNTEPLPSSTYKWTSYLESVKTDKTNYEKQEKPVITITGVPNTDASFEIDDKHRIWVFSNYTRVLPSGIVNYTLDISSYKPGPYLITVTSLASELKTTFTVVNSTR